MNSAQRFQPSVTRFPGSARLHMIGESVRTVPLEARVLGRHGGVVRLAIPCSVRTGTSVRLDVDGGHVLGRIIASQPDGDGHIGAVAVDKVVAMPSSIGMLAEAVRHEASSRAAAWISGPATA